MHALPVELLARIFTFYAEVLNNPSLPYPAWLSITHVCRRWRTIALSHSQLWTSVTKRLSLPWTKAFMERSGTMLMDFDIDTDLDLPRPYTRTCFYLEDIVLLLADFTRIRSLSLTGRCVPIIDSLRRLLPVQSFSLDPVDGDFRNVLPDDLFGGKALFAAYSWPEDATLSRLTGSSVVSPISQAVKQSRSLNFSTSSAKCLHLRILSFEVTWTGKKWTNCVPRFK
jgi:hypothetical protein